MTIEEYPTIRYRCSHCRKSWASKSRANKHVCAKDPARRACGTCVHDLKEYGDLAPGETCSRGLLDLGRVFRAECPGWSPTREFVSNIVEVVVKD